MKKKTRPSWHIYDCKKRRRCEKQSRYTFCYLDKGFPILALVTEAKPAGVWASTSSGSNNSNQWALEPITKSASLTTNNYINIGADCEFVILSCVTWNYYGLRGMVTFRGVHMFLFQVEKVTKGSNFSFLGWKPGPLFSRL